MNVLKRINSVGRGAVSAFREPKSIIIRKCTGYNQRPLDERSAVDQAGHKLYHLGKFLTRPGRARSILIMFGAYLVFAFSMYNLKTKITVDELNAKLKAVEEEKRELNELLIQSDILKNIEQKIRTDKVGTVSLKDEIRRIMFPTELEKDGEEYDRLTAARAAK